MVFSDLMSETECLGLSSICWQYIAADNCYWITLFLYFCCLRCSHRDDLQQLTDMDAHILPPQKQKREEYTRKIS